jgi:hypothetical protein
MGPFSMAWTVWRPEGQSSLDFSGGAQGLEHQSENQVVTCT